MVGLITIHKYTKCIIGDIVLNVHFRCNDIEISYPIQLSTYDIAIEHRKIRNYMSICTKSYIVAHR